MKAVAITLPDRIELVKTLEKSLGYPITIFNAIKWGNYLEDFKDFKHPLPDETITPGMIGCLLSHMTILKETKEDILIFEDDCELLATRTQIYDFIEGAPPHDILLLGATEYVESAVEGAYRKVGRFWGTHALILSEKAMRAAIKAFEAAVARGDFLPADWMYNEAIKSGLKAYGPSKLNALCQQKPGLVSAINGKIRQAPKV